jgi:hypothetical protein
MELHQQAYATLGAAEQQAEREDAKERHTSYASQKGKGKPFDKERWKDKECHNCKKKGHPAWACPKADDDEDDTSSSSTARSIKKLAKDFKSMKKSITHLHLARSMKKFEKELKSMKKAFTQLQEMKEADSDISDSEAS